MKDEEKEEQESHEELHQRFRGSEGTRGLAAVREMEKGVEKASAYEVTSRKSSPLQALCKERSFREKILVGEKWLGLSALFMLSY